MYTPIEVFFQRLKVFDAVRHNPFQMCHVFVYDENEILTAHNFISAIKSRRPRDEVKGQVYNWFAEYAHMKGSQSICYAIDYECY